LIRFGQFEDCCADVAIVQLEAKPRHRQEVTIGVVQRYRLLGQFSPILKWIVCFCLAAGGIGGQIKLMGFSALP